MITAKFTQQELTLMRYGIKYLLNCHINVAKGILSNCDNYTETEAMIEGSRLIGNIDSLIRNS